MADDFDQLLYRLRSPCGIGAPSDHDTMEEAAGEIERWRSLGEAILANCADDMAADGITCKDVWRKEALSILSK